MEQIIIAMTITLVLLWITDFARQLRQHSIDRKRHNDALNEYLMKEHAKAVKERNSDKAWEAAYQQIGGRKRINLVKAKHKDLNAYFDEQHKQWVDEMVQRVASSVQQ